MKIFDRTNPTVIANAIKQSRPIFIELYSGYTTPFILTEAYHDIRVQFGEPTKIPMSRGEYNHLRETLDILRRPSKLNESHIDDSLETPLEFLEFLKPIEQRENYDPAGDIKPVKKEKPKKEIIVVQETKAPVLEGEIIYDSNDKPFVSKGFEIKPSKAVEEFSKIISVNKTLAKELLAEITNIPLVKVKKGVEIKACFEKRLSVQECMSHLETLGAPVTKLWVEYSYQQLKEKT